MSSQWTTKYGNSSFTRRSFLEGLGSVAVACTASSSMEALAYGRSAAPAGEPTSGGAAGVHFEHIFAPAEGMVAAVEQPYRKDICLNGSWQFQPVALPKDFREGVDSAPELLAADVERWEQVALHVPSPWNVNSFADRQGQGGDFRCYPSYPVTWENIRMGWLRKTFHVPEDWQGCSVCLHFDAVAGNADVFVNGRRAGNHFDIFLPFEVDVTDLLEYGKANEVLVGIRKASLFDERGQYGRRTYQGGSFWGQHIAGIWQDVFLVARPPIRVSDVYIHPQVDEDTLQAEVELRNDKDRNVEVTIAAEVFPWRSKSGNTPITAPLPSSELKDETALTMSPLRMTIPAHGTAKTTLKQVVNSRLRLWSCSTPHLYGLVIKLQVQGRTVDSQYTRFGWRQVTLRGAQVLLNGEPIILRGDSWHFLGIPQLTRRYAWAWFTTLRAAGLNAVRLHAQPYPPFYLDVADEIGLLVLDETAIWASDGGPKVDAPAFWQDTERHLAGLIQRDRNHPCVFGWSVSNEVMPVVTHVMRNPPGAKDELIRHYSIWAAICRRLDPSRLWISADGEDDGEGRLPVYIVHYGGTEAMQRASASGKPWGVGEAGNAYYGSPSQVAETNGERAYESFQGRMEGVAISSYRSLIDQRAHHAVYRSVFNLVWYGLQPLALGLRDVSRPPTLENGIFFPAFAEGKPGVQPERLGPYCTTLNPGYDPSLPMYQPWPLYEAIRDAAAEPPATGKWSPQPAPPPAKVAPSIRPVTSAEVLSGEGSKLAAQLRDMGVPLDKLATREVPQILFVDGANPPGANACSGISDALRRGATVLVWGAAPEALPRLNVCLPAPIAVTSRTASSLLPAASSPITFGLEPHCLYFSDQQPPVITEMGLDGPLIHQSTVLLEDCNTDWRKWNNQPEYAKTAMVLRSERETKPSGVVLAMKKVGDGTLLITVLPPVPRTLQVEKVNRTILANLGIALGAGLDSGKPLLRGGLLVRALVCGFFPAQDASAPTERDSYRAHFTVNGRPWKPAFQENGNFDLSQMDLPGSSQNAAAYLSFWVFSPRSLEDLLLEPNLPQVNLEVTQQDAVAVWLNGQKVLGKSVSDGPSASASALRLHAGWNHFLMKVAHAGGRELFRARFTSNQPEFLAGLDSSLERP